MSVLAERVGRKQGSAPGSGVRGQGGQGGQGSGGGAGGGALTHLTPAHPGQYRDEGNLRALVGSESTEHTLRRF